MEIEEANMKSFWEIYSLKILIKQQTCYRNRSRPPSTDLILTNVPRMFQGTCVMSDIKVLSDFHLTTVTV